MWIKICANTSLADAQFAAVTGADAVGFVFASSPRQVTVDQVCSIVPLLPSSVEKIGVFVDAGFDSIVQAVIACTLTGIQLHHTEDPALATRLKQHFATPPGAPVRILQVVHYGPDLADRVQALRLNSDIDAILVDSRTAKAVGGTGIPFNWEAAQDSFSGSPARMVVAGGLNPENVTETIETLHPWGVDVASGVEASPGKKDPERVRAFIAAARAASVQAVKAGR